MLWKSLSNAASRVWDVCASELRVAGRRLGFRARDSDACRRSTNRGEQESGLGTVAGCLWIAMIKLLISPGGLSFAEPQQLQLVGAQGFRAQPVRNKLNVR